MEFICQLKQADIYTSCKVRMCYVAKKLSAHLKWNSLKRMKIVFLWYSEFKPYEALTC